MMHTLKQNIVEELKRLNGLDLSGYRPETLERRVAVRMDAVGLSDPQVYLKRVSDDPQELGCLIDTVLINVSAFFRNPLVFEIIANRVLPEIVARKAQQGSKEIRMWSAACGAGEEAYSLAILAHEALAKEGFSWTPRLFATDANQAPLENARAGTFLQKNMENVKLGHLEKHFVQKGGKYMVRKTIRDIVAFSHHDLLSKQRFAPAESVFGGFDLVLCRNVLIYYSKEVQARILERIFATLGEKGYLILGSEESLAPSIEKKLLPVDSRGRIYQKI